MTSACHAEDHGFESRTNRHGSIAQSVEQRTENPCVTGSIPVGATIDVSIRTFSNIDIKKDSPLGYFDILVKIPRGLIILSKQNIFKKLKMDINYIFSLDYSF